MYEEIKNYLQNEPRSRERRNRSRSIVNLLLRKYHDLVPFKEKLIEFIHEADSYDRIFRKVQSEHEELQGKDYMDKIDLEIEKQRSLGYNL